MVRCYGECTDSIKSSDSVNPRRLNAAWGRNDDELIWSGGRKSEAFPDDGVNKVSARECLKIQQGGR